MGKSKDSVSKGYETKARAMEQSQKRILFFGGWAFLSALLAFACWLNGSLLFGDPIGFAFLIVGCVFAAGMLIGWGMLVVNVALWFRGKLRNMRARKPHKSRNGAGGSQGDMLEGLGTMFYMLTSLGLGIYFIVVGIGYLYDGEILLGLFQIFVFGPIMSIILSGLITLVVGAGFAMVCRVFMPCNDPRLADADSEPDSFPSPEFIDFPPRPGLADEPAVEAAPLASPAAERRAKSLGVDLRDVEGTGPRGMILPGDVIAYKKTLDAAPPSVPPPPVPASPPPVPRGSCSTEEDFSDVT